ncbi:MAG: FAD binding domain-containing protein [Hyphomicrobiales bacterium]|nr:FAD binding domain-containing protein [Hyphomicrobiales bacterium]
MLTCDAYHTPKCLAEALELWHHAPNDSRYVAGATDLLPWAREGRAGDVHIGNLIDIAKLPELQGYRIEGGRLHLGAGLVFEDFLDHRDLSDQLPVMPFCAVWFADDQIRRQATLAGNIINASPAADGTPPLLAANAEIEIAALTGKTVSRRNIALGDFLLGPGRVALDPGEILTAITCDALPGYGAAFEKVGQRRSLVISVACAAALIKPSPDGSRFEDVRLALGGIGPVPVRLNEVESFLLGKPVAVETIAAATRLPLDRVASRTRRDYRRDVVAGFVDRVLTDALADCGIRITNPELSDA